MVDAPSGTLPIKVDVAIHLLDATVPEGLFRSMREGPFRFCVRRRVQRPRRRRSESSSTGRSSSSGLKPGPACPCNRAPANGACRHPHAGARSSSQRGLVLQHPRTPGRAVFDERITARCAHHERNAVRNPPQRVERDNDLALALHALHFAPPLMHDVTSADRWPHTEPEAPTGHRLHGRGGSGSRPQSERSERALTLRQAVLGRAADRCRRACERSEHHRSVALEDVRAERAH